MSLVKDEAKRLIAQLPEETTWDDIMHEFYVRNKIDSALKVVAEGKIVSHEEVKKRLFKRH